MIIFSVIGALIIIAIIIIFIKISQKGFNKLIEDSENEKKRKENTLESNENSEVSNTNIEISTNINKV